MPNSEGTLARALNELTALGTEQDREQLAALLDRLDAARLRVLVVGEAKRGKSTLVNAMLGREVLPSGVTPLTAVTTTVRYGEDERAEVRFLDGHDEKHPLAALADLVTERGNPANRRGIAGVTVYLVTTFAVLNKADHLDVHGLAEAVEFTRRVLGEAGHTGTVHPMSARAALRSGDDGFTPFRADFVSYLSNRRETNLHTSAVAQARRIADSLLDEVRLTRRAAGMRVGDAAQRVEQFSTRLSEVTVHSHDALIVVDGESVRLLFAPIVAGRRV